jgi:hypothetical protein
MTTDLTGLTFFPRPEDIPKSLAIAFMRMMMAHGAFELQVRTRPVVWDDLNEGPGGTQPSPVAYRSDTS